MKTDKTKNWTDSWKEQLDEYSVTPPPEVWEELSSEELSSTSERRILEVFLSLTLELFPNR